MSRTHRRRFAGTVAAMVCALGLSRVATASVRRDAIDAAEVARVRAISTRAVELLERGEALASAGELQEAYAMFDQALVESRGSPLVQRRRCQALTALGRRTEAVTACYRALESIRANANLRASVRALVSGPNPPTMAEAGLAFDLAFKARERAPLQLTPVAALCDIAASLGDRVMLHRCVDELERIAPDAPDTRRFEALLAPASRGWSGVGWSAIALASLGTIAHRLRARRRSARRAGAAAITLGALLGAAIALGPRTADADTAEPPPGMLSKWPVDDQDPEAHIPDEKERNRDPLEFGYWLQDVILRAEVYSKHGRHDVAVKLYRALALAVPERAIAFTKMCEEYEALGDREKAIASCGAALLRDGLQVKDYERYVHLVLARPGALTERQTRALGEVLAHMREDPAGRAAADALDCEVGVRTSNVAQLEACTTRLSTTAPDDPATLAYRWALAMLQGNQDDAASLVGRARGAGVAPEKIASMEGAMATYARQSRWRSLVAVAALALFFGAVAFLARQVRRRAARPAV